MSSRLRLFAPSARFVAILGILGSTVRPAAAEARFDNGAEQTNRQTLEAASILAGQSLTKLPIILTPVTPDIASSGVEGWTIPGPNGTGVRIFIYSGSAIFRCAKKGENYQCLLRLASVIVHEAWHFTHGAREDGAYAAQVAFLMGNQGDPNQIAGVRRARGASLKAERIKIAAAKKLSHQR